MLSAALHAAVAGLALLVPPGAEALALDDLYAPRPRTFVVMMPPPAASVVSVAAPGPGLVAAPTPSAPARGPRATSATHRGHAEPTDVLAAIAGRLSVEASAAPAFVASAALADLGATRIPTDGGGLDMIGVGRGAGVGSSTIGAPLVALSQGAPGTWASCFGGELEARAAVMGHAAAVASCNGARTGGVSGVATFATRGVARDTPDAIEASPRHGVFHCGCDAQGSLELEVIRRIVARHRSEIRGCYQRALEHRPDLEGRATARWTIAPSGGVQGASIDVERSDTHDAEVETCIAHAVSRWTFPSSSGPTVVSYPFVLGTDE